MIVPMENASNPTPRELAEQLFRKNEELEKRLQRLSNSKVPPDPIRWKQMQQNYETIILVDYEFTETQDVHQCLWQHHYKCIEGFRSQLKKAVTATPGAIQLQGRQGTVRLESRAEIVASFSDFLAEATRFYNDLIIKIKAKYGLALDIFSDNDVHVKSIRSTDEKKGVRLCHRCLLCLGDLARYTEFYRDDEVVDRNYTAASTYYKQAVSLWPATGNPHHQLAVLASYGGDDLVVLYRYFRSLAIEIPCSTAWDNLVIFFEKNRMTYGQLPSEAKAGSVKSVSARPSGRGRGRGEARNHLSVDKRVESSSINGKPADSPNTFTNFCTRFVRLNGILFTKTSLETFQQVFSSVTSDLHELLSSGPNEVLSFGPDATESALFIVRLVAILIFSVHNANRDNEGQSYKDNLQRSDLHQNAFVATFEFLGYIMKRCNQLRDVTSSYLLPAVLVFLEWLACHPDLAVQMNVEGKQLASRSFFWRHCVSFLNKLLVRGYVPADGDDGIACFSEMSAYDENESEGRLALLEDFELEGFLPLCPAHVILDFSKKHDVGTGRETENAIRAKRIVGAGKALIGVAMIDQQGAYYDHKLKKFVIGIKPPQTVEEGLMSFPDSSDVGSPDFKITAVPALPSKASSESEVEEEDEVIVFKPMLAEKRVEKSLPIPNAEVPSSFRRSFDGIQERTSPPVLASIPDESTMRKSTLSNAAMLASLATSLTEGPGLHFNPLTSTVPDLPPFFTSKLGDLNVNGVNSLHGIGFPHPMPLVVPLENVDRFGHPMPLAVPVENVDRFGHRMPLAVPVENVVRFGSRVTKMQTSDAMVGPKFDPFMFPSTDLSSVYTMPHALPSLPKKAPISRPVRHAGPPPGFGLVPHKQQDDVKDGSLWKDEPPLVDDFSWLDGYRSSTKTDTEHSDGAMLNNGWNSFMEFPFPGKQSFSMRSDTGNLMQQQAPILRDQLRYLQGQQQQQQHVHMNSNGGALLPEPAGQPNWSGYFYV